MTPPSTLPDHLEDLVLLGAAGYARLATSRRRTTASPSRRPDLRGAAGARQWTAVQYRQDLTALIANARAVAAGELWTEDER
jgi:hypothetical protein